jgi:predicted SprT family Zn-dependent metalloprotease
MLIEKQSEIPSGAKQLPKLEFITRRPKFVGLWGACDLCGQSSTRRWLFEKTTRGEVIVCVSCREQITHKSKNNEALDSWARLPGSYGG